MLRRFKFLVLFNLILFSFTFQANSQMSYEDTIEEADSNKIPEIYSFRFYKIAPDTIALDVNDILVCDSFCALGIPYTYDALHSFNSRRMDKFGGYLNVKINKGLEEIRNKGFASDIKNLYIQINPVTLKVYWFAVLGPSLDGKSYVRVDSRGSAGGGIPAVSKQLPRMHRIYDGLSAKKFLEFNDDVKVYYDWKGNQLCDFKGTVNIRQHFYKYGTVDPSIVSSVLADNSTLIDSIAKNVVKVNTPSPKTTKPYVKPKTKTYKVKAGDTLSEIAEKYHISLSRLKKANNLKSSNIKIGQVLKIPH